MLDRPWCCRKTPEIEQASKESYDGEAWKFNAKIYFLTNAIQHSLGEYWTCPKHVAEHGGKATHYTHGRHFASMDLLTIAFQKRS